MNTDDLRKRFFQLGEALEVDEQTWSGIWVELLFHHQFNGNRQRYDFDFVERCLDEFDKRDSKAVHPLAVELVMWFNKFVHDPECSDEENTDESIKQTDSILLSANIHVHTRDFVGRGIWLMNHDTRGLTFGDDSLVVQIRRAVSS